ncbi:MAG: hypothetical protein KC422_01040 [Trueperaceae bacterium]|nr:hypothetical protein [Trueperaceae bacterium]
MESLKLPVWPEDLIGQIRARVSEMNTKIIVLDDDPTGTQTVHDVPVYTDWTQETLRTLFHDSSALVYLLTNTRSMSEEAAKSVNQAIARGLKNVAKEDGRSFTLISRSDSTLRGHFPAELDALAEVLGNENLSYVLIPAFFEAGRETIGDVHFLHQDGTYIPVNELPFAKDAVFGFNEANLKKWAEEKSRGRLTVQDMASVDLATIRTGGPAAVLDKLLSASAKLIIVNASTYRDLEVVSHACIEAEQRGKRYLYRTAASFVVTRSGLQKRALLEPAEFNLGSDKGGLIVIGSHVPLSSQQLDHLLQNTQTTPLEVDVSTLLGKDANDYLEQLAQALNDHIREGRTVAVFTSRELITDTSDAGNLSISRRVSQSLVSLVHKLGLRPKFFIAKGGITSSDIATQGLKVKRAIVRGQILPGVPVWRLGQEASFPDLDYVVFPGNVGNASSLTEVVEKLTH